MKANLNLTFYKEERFKETPISKIPEDWEVKKLAEVTVDIKDTEHKIPKKVEHGVPFVSINYMIKFPDHNFVINENDPNLEFISEEEFLNHQKRFNVELGDILYSKWGTIGQAKFVNTRRKFIASCAIALIKPNKKMANPLFLTYVLNSRQIKRQIIPVSKTSTRAEFHIGHIKKLKIPFPPLLEQKAIAYILSTVDEAIQKTDEIIAKTERLKKGLLQELLTKGIGHKEFKDTEIGRIPKDWEVVRLKDVAIEIKPGFACGKRDENGVIQLRMDSIGTDGWINTRAYVKIPAPDNIDIEKYLLRPGDILFTNTSGSLELIGKTALYRGEFARCTYSNHLTRVRVRKEKATSEWVFYVLLKYWTSGLFKVLKVTQAGGQKSVGKNVLINLKLPLPSLKEQRKIGEVLSTVDMKLKFEKERKEKLQRIKKALMDLLLTGKIRVKVS